YFFIRKKKVLQEPEIDLIKSLEVEVFNEFGVKCELTKLFESKTKLFIIYYKIYHKVFKKVRPKSLYIVVAYYYAPIIKAAKDLGIKVYEVQHGIITKYHLGYSFPNIDR